MTGTATAISGATTASKSRTRSPDPGERRGRDSKPAQVGFASARRERRGALIDHVTKLNGCVESTSPTVGRSLFTTTR